MPHEVQATELPADRTVMPYPSQPNYQPNPYPAPTASTQHRRFDVALSYASEDRDYVQAVAEGLRSAGVRVFYDEFVAAELWGVDLYSYLDDVYRNQARFTVVFVSHNYAAKNWTAHERQSIQARALNELGPYLLPVRLDDAELPGLRPTVAYQDARRTSPTQLVTILRQKLGLTPAQDILAQEVELVRMTGLPRTRPDRQRLINERPLGWEYTLWASVMWAGKVELERKWHDTHRGLLRMPGMAYRRGQVDIFLKNDVLDALQLNIREFSRLLDSSIQDEALGKQGNAADPAAIEQYARQFITVYDGVLEWAARIRGAAVPPGWQPLIERAARLADTPLDCVRDFIDHFVELVADIPERVEAGLPINFHLTLTITLDNVIMDAMMTEYEKIYLASR